MSLRPHVSSSRVNTSWRTAYLLVVIAPVAVAVRPWSERHATNAAADGHQHTVRPLKTLAVANGTASIADVGRQRFNRSVDDNRSREESLHVKKGVAENNVSAVHLTSKRSAKLSDATSRPQHVASQPSLIRRHEDVDQGDLLYVVTSAVEGHLITAKSRAPVEHAPHDASVRNPRIDFLLGQRNASFADGENVSHSHNAGLSASTASAEAVANDLGNATVHLDADAFALASVGESVSSGGMDGSRDGEGIGARRANATDGMDSGVAIQHSRLAVADDSIDRGIEAATLKAAVGAEERIDVAAGVDDDLDDHMEGAIVAPTSQNANFQALLLYFSVTVVLISISLLLWHYCGRQRGHACSDTRFATADAASFEDSQKQESSSGKDPALFPGRAAAADQGTALAAGSGSSLGPRSQG